jgi:thymidylate synthase
MGIRVHPKSYQDKNVEGNPDFDTLELQNYTYCVTAPDTAGLEPTQPWASQEFRERVLGEGMCNPGVAWVYRPEVWKQFLQPNGKFAYTYDERMYYQLQPIITELSQNPDSRQLFLSIWDPDIDIYKLGGISRVPCSIGYIIQARRGAINLTYLMRSCDFATHFVNDVYLAHKLQRHIAEKVDMPVGIFTHYIASLHVFHKDVEGVF